MKNMERIDVIRYSLLALLLMTVMGSRADDSIPERMEDDSVSYELPKPKDFNAIRFSLDRHHRYMGDIMKKPNNFIDFGAGYTLVKHVNQNATEPLTTLHLRVGHQFNPLHAVRIGLTGGIGYMRSGAEGEGPHTLNGTYGAEADYLFSMSSYLLGYRPERPLDVSPFIGIGYNRAFLGGGDSKTTAYDLKESDYSFNLHAGVQLKIFTGPYASLTAEPFVQLNSDGYDLSDTGSNWHKYNVSYGVNLSYIYYFNNMLTPPSLTGDFKRRFGEGQRWLQGSDEDKAQRRPLFFHYGAGVALYNTFDDLRWGKTAGPIYSLGVGGWLSSAIGLRSTLHVANGSWAKQGDKINMMGYASLSVDALLNPFGFKRRYDWESTTGLTLIAGYEAGFLKMINTGGRNHSLVMGYHLAVQPWVRLAHDTRLYFEPMYSLFVHRQGKENRKRDDQIMLKLGIELLMGDRQDAKGETAGNIRPSGYFFGIGGGWNTTIKKYRYADHSAGFPKDAMLMAGYHFNEYNGIMVNEEYQTDAIQLANGEEQRWENWLTSVDYQLNLSNYFTGHQPRRRWNLSVMLGPTLAFNNEKTRFGLNAGLQLDYRFSRHFALFYQHRLYWMDKKLYDTDQFYNQAGTIISSMNIGLMYMLDDIVRPITYVANGAVKGISAAARGTGRGIGNLFRQQRSPFFIDYGYGLAWFPGMPAKVGDTFGNSLQLALGWWMLPSIGARVGANATKGGAIRFSDSQAGKGSDIITSAYMGNAFADLLINPLGFRSNYDWNQRFGVNLIGGLQYGFMIIEGNRSEARGRDLHANGWRLGMQLWVKLQENLRLHIEPMYTKINSNDIYIDDETNSRVTRNEAEGYHPLDVKDAMSLRIGLSALLQNPKKRSNGEHNVFTQPHFFAAVGGGWNFNLNKWRYDNSGANLNALAMGGYTFSKYHSLRAQFEYVSDDEAQKGQENQRNNMYFISLDYQLDMTTLLNGYDSQRRWTVSAFAGPSMDNCQSIGLNLGITADYRLDDHWGLFYNHNIYLFTLFDNKKLFTSDQIISRPSLLNTFNLGVSYHF